MTYDRGGCPITGARNPRKQTRNDLRLEKGEITKQGSDGSLKQLSKAEYSAAGDAGMLALGQAGLSPLLGEQGHAENGRDLRECMGLEGPWGESKTLQMSLELEAPEAGGGVRGVRGELGAEAALSVSLSGMRL